MKKAAATNSKIKYTIDKKSFFGHSAIMLMAMSAIFRVIGCWGMWNDTLFLIMHIALPIVSCILLILCVSFLGKKGFFLSCVPVIMGVVFFIYKAFSFENYIHMVLCILLYLAVAILYTGTVVGSIRTKWLLPPLFGLPFLYHVFVEDLPALSNTQVPVTFSAGMQEMSVLCIMAALFCVGMGLKRIVIPTELVIEAEPVMPDIPEPVAEPVPAEPVIVQGPQPEEPVVEALPLEESPAESLPEPETETAEMLNEE